MELQNGTGASFSVGIINHGRRWTDLKAEIAVRNLSDKIMNQDKDKIQETCFSGTVKTENVPSSNENDTRINYNPEEYLDIFDETTGILSNKDDENINVKKEESYETASKTTGVISNKDHENVDVKKEELYEIASKTTGNISNKDREKVDVKQQELYEIASSTGNISIKDHENVDVRKEEPYEMTSRIENIRNKDCKNFDVKKEKPYEMASKTTGNISNKDHENVNVKKEELYEMTSSIGNIRNKDCENIHVEKEELYAMASKNSYDNTEDFQSEKSGGEFLSVHKKGEENVKTEVARISHESQNDNRSKDRINTKQDMNIISVTREPCSADKTVKSAEEGDDRNPDGHITALQQRSVYDIFTTKPRHSRTPEDIYGVDENSEVVQSAVSLSDYVTIAPRIRSNRVSDDRVRNGRRYQIKKLAILIIALALTLIFFSMSILNIVLELVYPTTYDNSATNSKNKTS